MNRFLLGNFTQITTTCLLIYETLANLYFQSTVDYGMEVVLQSNSCTLFFPVAESPFRSIISRYI